MADRLERMGITTPDELLQHYPRTYLERRVQPIHEVRGNGEWVTLAGHIANVQTRRTKRFGLFVMEAQFKDETGSALLVWFVHRRGRNPAPRPPVRLGASVVVSGNAKRSPRGIEIHNVAIAPSPKAEEPLPLPGAELPPSPVYPLTEGITQAKLVSWVEWALQRTPQCEWLDATLLRDIDLPPLGDATRALHAPNCMGEIEPARRRVALEELLRFYAGALRRKEGSVKRAAPACPLERLTPEDFYRHLPFSPTRGQREAIDILSRELAGRRPMRRLLFGDVGSGKTVVGAFGALRAILSGHQSIVLAPTRILAEQHAQTLAGLLSPWNVGVHLVVGELPAREREVVIDQARAGEAALFVGTQALFASDLHFRTAAFAVVDEEHRFGVAQRHDVTEMGGLHLLSMSATPIPRTLAHVLYAEMDVTTLDGKPPGRSVVDTRWIHPRQRRELYAFVRREVERSRQAYVVFPRVEADEDGGGGAVAEAERLAAGELAGVRVGLLHGRQSSPDQERTMERFVAGEIDVLVATTVIEVGVDVPNATVMVIESADRFGLAQLHQLRGRVGRGVHQGYCLLVADPVNDRAMARIHALRSTNDGLKLAELDLELRGPGEFYGLRQSGRSEFKRVCLTRDQDLFRLARRLAPMLLKDYSGQSGSET